MFNFYSDKLINLTFISLKKIVNKLIEYPILSRSRILRISNVYIKWRSDPVKNVRILTLKFVE